MATTTVEFANLLALDPSVLDTAWCAFLSNPRAWALVIPEDRREEILKTGFDGWSSTTKLNTTRLAKLFRDNFGVTLVSSSFLIYRNAFLFGIALAWGVEANQYDLDAQQSEAAFAVSDVIGGKRINVPGGAEVFGDETADEDEEFSAILPWDSPSIPLPTSLAAAWQRAHTPMSMETRSYLLEDVPEVDEVPTRAPENNHRRDNQHGLDKVIRSWQTSLLGNLRLLSTITDCLESEEPSMDPQELVHRTFFMTAELMHRVEDYRKTRSIPTSVAKANVLFDKNDLAVANFQKSINRLGGSNKGGFRYGKGKGKGKGGKSYGGYKGYGGGYSGYKGGYKTGGYGRGKSNQE